MFVAALQSVNTDLAEANADLNNQQAKVAEFVEAFVERQEKTG